MDLRLSTSVGSRMRDLADGEADVVLNRLDSKIGIDDWPVMDGAIVCISGSGNGGLAVGRQLHPGKQRSECAPDSWDAELGARGDSELRQNHGQTNSNRTAIGNGEGEESMSRPHTSASKAQTVIIVVTRRPAV